MYAVHLSFHLRLLSTRSEARLIVCQHLRHSGRALRRPWYTPLLCLCVTYEDTGSSMSGVVCILPSLGARRGENRKAAYVAIVAEHCNISAIKLFTDACSRKHRKTPNGRGCSYLMYSFTRGAPLIEARCWVFTCRGFLRPGRVPAVSRLDFFMTSCCIGQHDETSG